MAKLSARGRAPRRDGTVRRRRYAGAALLGFLFSAAFGCSPLYVMRAAYEEGKILWRREPIVSFLDRPNLESDTREKLRMVLAVREYARDVLKLNVGGSYASYSYVDRPDLSYILTAAPKTALEPYTWWFLIVGRVPYKGYFSRDEAEGAAERLRARGYDTNIRTTAAFSTLGWFDDPLLAHLLKYDKVVLADVVLHELFHNTLYVKGAGNFNESVATFVGGRGAIVFFRDRLGPKSAEYQRALQAWRDELEFSAYLEEVAATLETLYAQDIAYEDKLRLREEVFARAKNAWRARTEDRPQNRFRRFAEQTLNNAVLIQYLLYFRNLELFEALYHKMDGDLVETIAAIRKAVSNGREPFAAVRALLEQKTG